MEAPLLDRVLGFGGVELQLLTAAILDFFLVSLRIGAFLLSAPFFAAPSIPLQVRIVATVAIALAFHAHVAVPVPGTLEFLGIVRVALVEIAIGLSAGLVLTILFAAAALAGEVIAATGGLSFAAQIDPTSGGQTPVVSQILTLFLIVIFLSLDGHLHTVAAIRQSYDILPIGAGIDTAALVRAGLGAAGDMFALAAVPMLPVVAILLLTNVTVGVVTRSAPQLNLFSFGFPLTLITVFVALYMTATPMGYAFVDLVEFTLDGLDDLLGGLAGG